MGKRYFYPGGICRAQGSSVQGTNQVAVAGDATRGCVPPDWGDFWPKPVQSESNPQEAVRETQKAGLAVRPPGLAENISVTRGEGWIKEAPRETQ